MRLIDSIPRPSAGPWKWSEVNIKTATLMELKYKQLIIQEEDGWRTPEKTIREIQNYGSVERVKEIGISTGELRREENQTSLEEF